MNTTITIANILTTNSPLLNLSAVQTAVILALAGLGSESMVRDPAWRFLDIGRRLERALAVLGAVAGALIAGRHVWLQGLPADRSRQIHQSAAFGIGRQPGFDRAADRAPQRQVGGGKADGSAQLAAAHDFAHHGVAPS